MRRFRPAFWAPLAAAPWIALAAWLWAGDDFASDGAPVVAAAPVHDAATRDADRDDPGAGRVDGVAASHRRRTLPRVAFDPDRCPRPMVRGTVRDAEGRPVVGARVALLRITPPAPVDAEPVDGAPPASDVGVLEASFAQEPTAASSADRISAAIASAIAERLRDAPADRPLALEFRFEATSFVAPRIPTDAAPTHVLEALVSARASLDVSRTTLGLAGFQALDVAPRVDRHAVRPVTEAPADEEDTGLSGVTDAEGRFSFCADVDGDRYVLRAQGDCCLSETSAPWDPTAEADVRVTCWAALAGRVAWQGGFPSDARLDVRVVDGDGRRFACRPGAVHGAFVADGLAPGDAVLEISVDGGPPLARVAGVRLERGVRTVDPRLDPFRLEPYATRVAVSVHDRQGRPVPRHEQPWAEKRGGSAPVRKAVDATGAARFFVRHEGDAFEAGADLHRASQAASVRTDARITLQRYRVVDLVWTGPSPLEADDAGPSGFARLEGECVVTFTPHDGGAGWTSVLDADPGRIYFESAGRVETTWRVRGTSAVEGAPAISELVPWSATFDVIDADAPQTVRLAPPTSGDLAAALPRLRERLEAFGAPRR
ncbi:MAG TPA: hypothetical protein VEI02_11300 [Planctomycetota bacterium]|nr:hypothetical protein [Planctomycetota bacterium]